MFRTPFSAQLASGSPELFQFTCPLSRGTDHPPLVGTMGETNYRKLLLQEKLLAGGARCGSEGYPDGSSLARWEFCYLQDPPQHRLPHLPLNPNGGEPSLRTRSTMPSAIRFGSLTMVLSSAARIAITSTIWDQEEIRRLVRTVVFGTGIGGVATATCSCVPSAGFIPLFAFSVPYPNDGRAVIIRPRVGLIKLVSL